MNTTSIRAGADLEDWYLRFAPRLLRATHRIVGNTHDAEDATQDAFLSAWRAHGRYRADSDPYPWLARIATRKAYTIAAGRVGAVVETVDEATLVVPSAEDEVLARERAWCLQALVEREIPVKLHLIDGLRFRDVSLRLGIPTATAATRIRRGKRRLREALAAGSVHAATHSYCARSKTA